MRNIKNIILAILSLSVIATPALVVSSAYAAATSCTDIQACVNSGTCLDVTGGASDCGSNANADTSTLNTILHNAVNIFSAVVGVVAVLMMIVGGLRYITSGGDTNKVGAAKTTILYAIVGLAVVMFSQVIVHFVLNTSSSILQ